MTPENVTMHITDSSARPEHREQLEAEIRKAHVICIVYAIDDPNTFNRLPLYWLPYIRSLGVNVSKREMMGGNPPIWYKRMLGPCCASG